MMLVAVTVQSVFNLIINQGVNNMAKLASNYIGGRFTATPEDHFSSDGVGATVYQDDGDYTYFELEDGSRLKVNPEGEIFAA